jgi:hypothetical protein
MMAIDVEFINFPDYAVTESIIRQILYNYDVVHFKKWILPRNEGINYKKYILTGCYSPCALNFVRFLVNESIIMPCDYNHYLIAAIKSSNYDVAVFLINRGADFFAKNHMGLSAYFYWKLANGNAYECPKYKKGGGVYFRDDYGCNCYNARHYKFFADLCKDHDEHPIGIILASRSIQNTIPTLTKCQDITITPDDLFAVLRLRKNIDFIFTNFLTSYRETVNIKDPQGVSLFARYLFSQRQQLNYYIIERFLDDGAEIIVNGVKINKFHTRQKYIAEFFPQLFVYTDKNNNSLDMILVKETQCLERFFKRICDDFVDYHHKNNDNHTIIDVILMNEFISREAKEYIFFEIANYHYDPRMDDYDKTIKKYIDRISCLAPKCPMCRLSESHVAKIDYYKEFECCICMRTCYINVELECHHKDFCVDCIAKL